MANYLNLKAAIADVIKTNGTKAITGQVLQDVLNSIVSVIGANYQFAGVATPSTNPGTPDQNVLYFATETGLYPNFGGVNLERRSLYLLMWNGSWHVDDSLDFGDIYDEYIQQFINLLEQYQPIVIEGNVVNAPDEEDLTSVNNLLKFKNKAYFPENFSGLGRVFLRKNIVNGANVLTQAMMSETNTIYIIQYDYTLGDDITIPADCVLEFDGGSISGNKTLTGNNTGIEAGLVKIFSTDITLAGTWNIAGAYPEWFGAVKESGSDSRIAIQKCLDYFNKTVLSGKYTLASSDNNGVGITIPLGKILQGNAGSNIYMLLGDNLCKIVATSSSIKTIVEVRKGSQLKDFAVEGYLRTNEEWQVMPTNEEDILKGISAKDGDNVSRLLIDGIEVSFCNIGMDLQAYLSTCRNSICSRCTGGFYIHGKTNVNYTSFKLERCYAALSAEFGYKLFRMIYSSIDTCACDHCGIDENTNKIATSDFTGAYDITGSDGISIISCGAENILSVLYCIGNSAISIVDCRWQASYNSNMTNWIFLKNNNGCVINISHEIANCPSDWKYVRIEGWNKTSSGYDIRGLSAENIDIISTGAGVSNTDIAKTVRIFGAAVRTYTISDTQFIDNILMSAKVFNQNTIEINADSDNIYLRIDGGEYYDSFNSTTLIINGKENGNTQLHVYSIGRHNIFTNFKNIILNNISILFTDNRQIEGFIFKNTNVVLNNVACRTPSSKILFTSENTKIEFNNSIIDTINAKYVGEVCGIINSTDINNKYLVKNTAVTFSNGLVGYINDSVGRTVRFQFEVTSTADLTAKFADLTTNEKLLVVGSVGLVNNKPYWWDGTDWVDATGTQV